MKTNLDRAKELIKKIFKVYLHTENTWTVMNKHIVLESGWCCHSGEYKKSETAREFCNYINKETFEEAKQLKEKVEKGCGDKFLDIRTSSDEIFSLCGISFRNNKTRFCKDCQETRKILKEILE